MITITIYIVVTTIGVPPAPYPIHGVCSPGGGGGTPVLVLSGTGPATSGCGTPLPPTPPPPSRGEQTENITFRHLSDAGGKYTSILVRAYTLCRHIWSQVWVPLTPVYIYTCYSTQVKKGLAAMLAAPEVTCIATWSESEESICNNAYNWGIHLGFETQDRHREKSKTARIGKRTCALQILYQKKVQHTFPDSLAETVRVCGICLQVLCLWTQALVVVLETLAAPRLVSVITNVISEIILT